jgi:hypothetical protein
MNYDNLKFPKQGKKKERGQKLGNIHAKDRGKVLFLEIEKIDVTYAEVI